MLSLIPVLGALDPVALLRALPGSVSQGLIWDSLHSESTLLTNYWILPI